MCCEYTWKSIYEREGGKQRVRLRHIVIYSFALAQGKGTRLLNSLKLVEWKREDRGRELSDLIIPCGFRGGFGTRCFFVIYSAITCMVSKWIFMNHRSECSHKDLNGWIGKKTLVCIHAKSTLNITLRCWILSILCTLKIRTIAFISLVWWFDLSSPRASFGNLPDVQD